jgi:membrane protease YdiL (CAAX protease family)
VLGWIRERTRSLGAAICLHAANNLFAWLVVGLGTS